jgi:poly-gamma-glutamate synthesis protein (capsule biosynthesis protein)
MKDKSLLNKKYFILPVLIAGGIVLAWFACQAAGMKIGDDFRRYGFSDAFSRSRPEGGGVGEINAGGGAADTNDGNDKTAVISMVGDIMLASGMGEVIEKKGPGYPWQGVRDILAGADVTLGNLECAVSDKKYEPVPGKQYTFLARPEALAGARDAGIDVLALANNHILDYGVAAMADTLDLLEDNGIMCTGAGKDLLRAASPVLIEKNGLRVGVLAFSYVFPQGWWVAGAGHPGLAGGYDYDLVYRSVRDLSAITDITVVAVHWGKELADRPTEAQKKLAHNLVDRGADVVWGHHPHVLQGIEIYNKGLIAYSLGNFIFTVSRDVRGRQSAILQADAGPGGITGARVIPAWIEYGRTVPADEKKHAVIIQRLRALSEPLGTAIDENGEIAF